MKGRLDDEAAAAITDFWERHGALDRADAPARLRQVVCVLRDPVGEVAGVNSAYADAVPLVGGRRFWIYRRFLAHGVPVAADEAMVAGAIEALEAAFDPEAGGPIGVCVLVDDVATMRRRREGVWPVTGLRYAGYDGAGRQVRIRYFERAMIA